MIPNCKGCEEDFKVICDMAIEGFHFAGILDGHIWVIMVDDKGKVVAWH